MVPQVGFEPTTYGLENRYAIHCVIEVYWCYRRDSNPHFCDFKSQSSANWDTIAFTLL